MFDRAGGREECWRPNGGQLGAKSLGWVEGVMGHVVEVEQVTCLHGQVAVVGGCVCRWMAVE